MTKAPDEKSPVPLEIPQISIDASAHAPLLYFEEASAFSFMNGIVRITLEAVRIYPNSPKEGVTMERIAVAHLRMNAQAALALKGAIDGALLLATPPGSDARN